MLAKRRSGHSFTDTVSWRARGTVALWADRNVGTLVCPASPRPTSRCVLRRPDPPVVCPGFGLDRFVLPEEHPGGQSIVERIVWGVREFVFYTANNPIVGVLCCPSPPGPAVSPCAAQYRPARGMSGFWIRQVDSTGLTSWDWAMSSLTRVAATSTLPPVDEHADDPTSILPVSAMMTPTSVPLMIPRRSLSQRLRPTSSSRR